MKKARILIVEDEAIIAMEVESQLQSLGYEVISIIDTGEKAIEKAEIDKPDLILMDIRIKGEMDGIDAAEEIRNRFGIPVIFSTSYLDEERIKRAKIAIPFGYVLKPIQERDLKVSIEIARYVSKVDAERKKAEEALRASEERYRSIIENASVGIFQTTPGGRHLSANRAGYRMWGFSSEQEMKESITDLSTQNYDDPKDREHFIETIERDGGIEGFEAAFRTKNGDKIRCSMNSRAIYGDDGQVKFYETFIQDITVRKKAEEALLASEKHLSATLRSIGDGVISCSTDATVTRLNAVAEKLTGWNTAEAKGRSIGEVFNIVDANTKEKTESPIERSLKEGVIVGLANHTMLISRDGKEYQIADSCAPIKGAEGEVIGAVLVFRDVTEEYKQREALRTSFSLLDAALESTKDGILVVDRGGKITKLNQKFLDLWQIPKDLALTGDDKLLEYVAGQLADPEGFLVKVNELYDTPEKTSFDEITFADGRVFERYSQPQRLDTQIVGRVWSFHDITGRKQAEDEQRKLAAVVKHTAELVNLTTIDGRMIFLNEAGARMLGIDAHEVNDRNLRDVIPDHLTELVQKELIPILMEGKTWQGELQYRNMKTGHLTDVQAMCFTVNDPDTGNPLFLANTSLDITGRKQTEEALRKSEALLSDTFNSIQDGLSVLDKDLNIIKVNHIMDERHSDNMPLVGKKCYECYHNADKPCDPCPVLKCLKTGKTEQEIVKGVPGSADEWIELFAYPIQDEKNGQISGAVEFVRVITEQKKSRELMIQTEKMMSVGGLAAGMAHEINNPLGGILQCAQNILRRFSPDLTANHKIAEETGIDLQNLQLYMEKRDISSYLDGIRESGMKASQIISNMLQFSRKSESKMAPTDLFGLMENILEIAGTDYDLKKKYDFRNIKIVKEFNSDLPFVPCNKTEIEQVVLNLLNNAAWAMAEINVADPQITLRICREQEMSRIEVEDNGPGIVEKNKKQIFEPFFTTKPVGEGTGLGLSVSYMIITNNHKGTMEVESEVGKGSKFIIRLPLNRE